MKTFAISLCFVLLVVTVGAIALSVHYSNQAATFRHQWQADSRLANAKLDNYAAVTESNQEIIANLEPKANQLNVLIAVTNDLGARLQAANGRIQTLEAAVRQQETDENLIPPPTIKDNAFYFPKVLSAQNLVLASNATFAYITGKRLVFHPENQIAVVVDVDDINPLILQYLGINADNAKAKQAQMDAAYAADRQAGAIAQAQYAKQMEAQGEREAALAVQQEQADAAMRQAQAAQAQAAADKEKADAAMLNASKPQQPIIVIQQQQQQKVIQQPPPTVYWSH